MRDVGDEVGPLALHLLQGVGHGVERLRQLSDLVTAVLVAVDPHVKFAPPELSGRLRHLGEGAGLVGRGDGAGDHRDEQDHHRREEEDGGCGPPHLGQAAGVPRHQDKPQVGRQGRGQLGLHWQPRDIAVGPIDPAQIGDAVIVSLLEDLLDHPVRDLPVVETAVCGVQDLPLGVGDDHRRLRDRGDRLHRALIQRPFDPVQQAETVHILQIVAGGRSDIARVPLQPVPGL